MAKRLPSAITLEFLSLLAMERDLGLYLSSKTSPRCKACPEHIDISWCVQGAEYFGERGSTDQFSSM